MMILRTRKEQYLNEIVGNGNTAPGTPYTREELFFADILGEVNAPVPVTRIEIYLAKIANKYNRELPQPKTRIEKFIARAAGMDVIIPTPITREEMLWANYALIIEKELSGIPPLTFNAIAGTLKNYRVYGNTVNGESVGDRTGNLVDKTKFVYGYRLSNIGTLYTTPSEQNVFAVSEFIEVNSGEQYIISQRDATRGYARRISFYQSKNENSWLSNNDDSDLIFTVPNTATYLRFTALQNYIDSIMLIRGTSLPTQYEPYGYKVPVTVTNGTDTETTNIYLDEQLTKSGDNADYIDYATQKRHNSDGTESSVTLPEIAVTAGTNTLSVGTEVQPSNVYIKYEGAR